MVGKTGASAFITLTSLAMLASYVASSNLGLVWDRGDLAFLWCNAASSWCIARVPLSARRSGRTRETDIHLAFHVSPLLRSAQHSDQLIEETRVLGCELEPGQKVERPAQLARVVEPPCDRGEIFKGRRNMVRALLEDRAPLILGQIPPGS